MSVKFQNIKSTGFIDGYKASNFESNSSVIKYYEEELADLLRLLYANLVREENNNNANGLLINSLLKKAEDKLVDVHDYKEAEEVYIHSVQAFKSFLETLKEINNTNLSPTDQLYIKKILHHYKMLGEKSLIDELIPTANSAEKTFLIAS